MSQPYDETLDWIGREGALHVMARAIGVVRRRHRERIGMSAENDGVPFYPLDMEAAEEALKALIAYTRKRLKEARR